MRTTYKYRLYPTRRQALTLTEQVAEACRLYNAAVQERRDAYQRSGVSLNSKDGETIRNLLCLASATPMTQYTKIKGGSWPLCVIVELPGLSA